MQIKNDSDSFPVHRYSPSLLGQGSGAGYSVWLDQAINAAANKLPPEVVIDIQQGSGIVDSLDMTFALKGSVFYFPFVWVESDNKYTEVRVNTTSQEFSIRLTMQSLTSVTIEPGQLYDGSFVKNYTQPADFFSNSPFAQKAIWGTGGLFNTQLTKIFIAFRPTVRASFDADSYNRVKRELETKDNLNVGIGPFFLNADGNGASGTKDDFSWDDERYSLEFTDKTLFPKIIAVSTIAMNYSS